MNYFLISNMYPDEKSPGYGSFVKNICDRLSDFGFKQKCTAVIKGQPNTKLNKIISYLKTYFEIIKCYFKSYDFIYIHYPNQFIPILFLLRTIKKRKIIINFHGDDILYSSYGYRKILGKITESFCKKYADAVVIPSEYFRNIILEKHIINDSKIIVSPSGGINPDIFFPPESKSLNKNKLHLGFVGRLKVNKGIMDFAEVCKILNNKNNLILKATVIGYGECYEDLINYINTNKLTENFTVIKGVPQVELGKYYREMDLFIFNSKRKGESLGLTGLEAMGCGVPVIGSNIGGIATYVKDGYNGWLTAVDDVNDIIKKIEFWIDLSIKEKEDLRANAVATSKKYYTDNISSSLAMSLKEILISK